MHAYGLIARTRKLIYNTVSAVKGIFSLSLKKIINDEVSIVMTYDQSYMRSHYRDVFTIAMRCGENMAQNGAEAFRVEDTAIRILKTTGFAYAEAHVSVTGLILSLDDPSMPHEITLVKRIQDRTSNLLQISRTNDISRRFVEGQLSVEDAQKELDALNTAATYPAWLVALAITCVGPFFTLMFNGTLADALSSLLICFITGIVTVLIDPIKMPLFLKNLISALVIGFSFVLSYDVLSLGQTPGSIISGSIMPLVPGMLLTVSIRDLLNGDYISGVARGLEAVLIALAIAAGVSISIRLAENFRGSYSLSIPDRHFITYGQDWPIPLWTLFQGLFSFISTYGFIIVFKAQKSHLLPCGIIGGLTWFIYCLLTHYMGNTIPAIFIASLAASIMSYRAAVRLKSPATVFFTGGIFCLVPGAGIFRVMYYYLSHDVSDGNSQLLLTLETAGLIALAIAFHTAFHSLIRSLLARKKPDP